jgi:hypothetical protein
VVDIDANLDAFLAKRVPGRRYASFDYCFNYFQEAREAAADKSHLQTSCLQLGFYLASWGMMRGSGELLGRSARDLVPVVEAIAAEPASTWELDAHRYLDGGAVDVVALSTRIRKAFSFTASDILVTKTMLGVFGCVPAFDRYFKLGFGCSTFSRSARTRIGRFYADNHEKIDGVRVSTLDFATGEDTGRLYSRAKLIDMVFWQEGINQNN